MASTKRGNPLCALCVTTNNMPSFVEVTHYPYSHNQCPITYGMQYVVMVLSLSINIRYFLFHVISIKPTDEVSLLNSTICLQNVSTTLILSCTKESHSKHYIMVLEKFYVVQSGDTTLTHGTKAASYQNTRHILPPLLHHKHTSPPTCIII